MNQRELKIIIKADGSLAAEELDKVNKELTELGKDAAKTGRELDKVDKELTDLGKDSSRTSQELDKVGKELTELGQESHRSGQQLNQTVRIIVQSANASKQASQSADGLGRSLKKTSQDSSYLDRALGKIGQTLKHAGSEMKSFQSEIGEFTFAANQTLELLEKVGRYAQIGWNFAKQGAQLRESKDAFDDYARSIGKSSDDILNKLRKASGGTIDDMSLIQTASKAMSLGVTTDSTKMANLLEVARNKARLFGVDTRQAFEDIVTGIGRGSPQILDNLGIRIPAAFEQMTEGMSDAQKVAVLFEMTLEEGNKQLEGMGGMTDTSADSFRRLEASWKNLKETGGELVSNVLVPINNALAIGMDGATGLLNRFNELFDFIANLDQEAPIRNMSEGELLELLSEKQQLYKKYKAGWLNTLKEVPSPANSFRTSESLSNADKIAGEMQNKAFEQNMLAMDKRIAVINRELDRRSKSALEQVEKSYSTYSGILSSGFATGLPGFDPLSTRAKTKEEIEQIKKEKADLEKQKREAEALRKQLEREEAERKKNLYEAQKRQADIELGYLFGDLKRATTDLNDSIGGIDPSPIADKFERASRFSVEHLKAVTAAVGPAGVPGKSLAAALNDIPDLAKAASDSLLKIKADNFMALIKELKNEISVPETWLNLFKQLSKSPEELAQQRSDAAHNRQQARLRQTEEQWRQEEEDRWLTQMEKLHSALRINVADAFESGLYDAMNGGNFFKSFGNALKSQIAKAASTAITTQIFGSDGIYNLGGLFGFGSGSASSAGSASGSSGLVSSGGLLGKIFKPIYNSDKSLNWGALGQNLAVGAAFSFLTSPGRLFGGSVVKGQESFNSSSSLNDQVTQAKELRDRLFIQAGISDVTRQLLDEAEFAYSWVRKTKSGNGITSKKTTTYLLEGSSQAQASIDNIRKLQDAVLGEQAQHNLSLFQVSRSDSIKALEMAVWDAASAMSAVLARNEDYDGTNSPYKYSLAERTAMQQQYEQSKIDLTVAKESGRTNLMQTFLGSSTLASFAPADIMKKLLGDSALGNDASMIQSMLPLLKQAGLADFDMTKMMIDAGSDPEEQYDVVKKQKEYLERAASVYEQLWKDAEQEALNMSLSIEQQKAAFERFQAAQSSLLDVKEQLLQQEQQLAAIERQKLEGQRVAQMESALSLIGEVSQRGDKIMIIQGGDSATAIKELMAEFADNPEVTAVLKSTLEKTEAKARWG